MKVSTVLSIFTSACLISFCIAVGPFDPEDDDKLSPKPSYQYDGDNTLFREGDIVGNPFKRKSDRFGEAATVGKAWKDGRIPYVIDCSLKYILSAVNALQDAIDEWQSKTCVRFVPKEATDQYFVTFLRSAGCWASYVGFQRKNTTVSIGNGCEYKHVMVHELGHVIGFWHEQSRPDRDNYVSVVRSNVLPSLLHNFDKVTSKTQSHGEEYDYESIMHYPLNAFAINRDRKTLIPLRDLGGKQPYVKLSKSDVIQTNKMYNCPTILDVGAAVAKDDECFDEHIDCPLWAEYFHCDTNPEPLLLYCRKSCKNCGPCVDKPSCPVFYDYRFCVLRATSSMRDCKALCRVCVPEPTTAPTAAATTTAATTTAATTTAATTTAPTTTAPTLRSTEATAGKILPTSSNSEIQLPSIRYIGVICADHSDFCAEWKKDGRCEREDWVKLNCLISCNRVDICDLEALKPSGSCATSLGLSLAYKDVQAIPDNHFTATSFFRPGGGWGAPPRAGRLYFTDDHTSRTVGAWCASPNFAENSRLEVDLGKVKRITGIATQGRDVYFEHVRSYEITYKEQKNDVWKPYSIAGETKVLTGNCDHFTPVLNILEITITARFVRLHPKTYRGAPCMRVEFYGCDA